MKPAYLISAVGTTLSIVIALYLRWQTAPIVQNGWLDTDVYRFVRQAEIISQRGKLPERDEMRWAPLGRDLSRQLSFSSYCLAGLYRVMRWIRPTFTLFKAALIYPLLCFALSQGVFYLLMKRLFNRPTVLVATLLFAVIPTTVIRSSAGYADRDALSLLLGLTTFLCLVQALDAPSMRGRAIWSGLAGIAQMLLNATWEGSGLFSAVLAGFFLVKVLWGQISRTHALLYVGWAFPSLLSLLFWTKTYHNLKPYALLAWGAPLLGGVVIGTFFIGRHFKARLFKDHLPLGVIAFASSLLVGIVAVGVFASLHTTSTADIFEAFWDNIQSPLGKSRLMRSVGELFSPYATDWAKWYGISFLFMVAGSLLVAGRIAHRLGINLWVGMVFWQIFIGSMVYSRFSASHSFSNDSLSQLIFAAGFLALVATLIICSWWLTSKRELQGLSTSDSTLDKGIFTLAWFILMLMVARGTQRYHFFLAPIAVGFLAYALVSPIGSLWHRSFMRVWRWPVLGGLSAGLGFFLFVFVQQSLGAIKTAHPTVS